MAFCENQLSDLSSFGSANCIAFGRRVNVAKLNTEF